MRTFLDFFMFCKNTYIFLANSISTVYNYIKMHYQDTRKHICIVRMKTMNSNDILIANTDDLRSDMDYLEKTLLKGHRIDPNLYEEYDVKRGLRDSTGRGVLTD